MYPLDSLGSPPRGRGKALYRVRHARSVWITPAWAGKRRLSDGTKWCGRDHPRVGGEKSRLNWGGAGALGSPPRGRGKVMFVLLLFLFYRITPAWAGKSTSHSAQTSNAGDHPRVGGEKVGSPKRPNPEEGSPPRGRGKDLQNSQLLCMMRITPAWAGKRNIKDSNKTLTGDHPRVGGEKRQSSSAVPCVLGSPPRGRGKACSTDVCFWYLGITPAWAGKRETSANTSKKKKDHPRVGGEKHLFCRLHKLVLGSPPRGRGKACRYLLYPLLLGITPAWAGKRRRTAESRGTGRDHPRVGGEKSRVMSLSAAMLGSPPRGRGKGSRQHQRERGHGITPAWAGKSARRPTGSVRRWDHPRVGGEKSSAIMSQL